MKRFVPFAAFALALGAIAWLRLVPLGLPVADERAEAEVRAEILAALDPGFRGDLSERAATDPRVAEWLATNPQEAGERIHARADALRAEWRSDPGDEPEHVYLGDYDSYLWLRLARNVLEHGSPCDTVVDGVCRNTLAHAPFGREMFYSRSLHVYAVAGLHRVLTLFADVALSTSAFLLPLLVALAGAAAAFAIGWFVGGTAGGFLAAILTGSAPIFLHRSLGADNDVWNVALPIVLLAALLRAATRERIVLAVGWALLASAVVGIHAATWDGWRIYFVGLFAGLVLLATLRWFEGRASATRARLHGLRAPLAVLGAFTLGSAVAVTVSGSDYEFVRVLTFGVVDAVERLWRVNPLAGTLTVPQGWKPSSFGIVEEMLPIDAARLVDLAGTLWFLPFAWIAVPVLALPARPRGRDWGAVGLAALAFAGLLFVSAPFGLLCVAASFVVVAACAATRYPGARTFADGRALLVLAWPLFVGGLMLAAGAQRFVLLLVAPAGIVLGAAVGILHLRLREIVPTKAGLSTPIRGLAWALVAVIALQSLRAGYAQARGYVPRLHDGWQRTLAATGDALPDDGIVTTWWDHGYWAQYIARRATTMDGASLRTEMPYWVGRALASRDEGEAIGILRMLACGSAARGFPEEHESAEARLRAAGLDDIAAAGMIEQLVLLDRAGAIQRLVQRGLSSEQIAAVLERTHCAPPDSAMVISSAMATAAIWRFATWNLARAFVVDAVDSMAAGDIGAVLVRDFDYEEAAATALIDRVRRLPAGAARQALVAGSEGYFTPDWVACEPDGAEWLCPLDIRVQGRREGFTGFRYDPRLPVTSRIVYERWGSDGRPIVEAQAVGTVWIASAEALTPFRFRNAEHPNLAVVVDTVGRRLLLGTPRIIDSQFTRLVFLDGHYSDRFQAIGAHASLGERVSSWRIDWSGD